MPAISAKTVPWYRRRWSKLTAIMIGALIALIIVTTGILYAAWQTRPEKSLLDAANHALVTPGTYTITSPGTDMTIGVRDHMLTAEGMFKTVPINAVFNENTLYVKSPQPDKLYDMYLSSGVPDEVVPAVKSIITKLKDKWISIDLYKLPASIEAIGTARCSINGINQLHDGTLSQMQIAVAYLSHQFITAKTLNASPIQTTYRVSADQNAFKDFYADVIKKSNSININSQACTATSNPMVGDKFDGTTLDVSISRPDHHLRTITMHDASNITTAIKADYAKIPTISIPTDPVTYDQIASILMKSYISSFLGNQ